MPSGIEVAPVLSAARGPSVMRTVPLATPAPAPEGDRRDLWWLAAALVLAVALIVSFFNKYAIDDSFIGYANAQNLAAGRGFAFNPGDRFLTTSAPLVVPVYALFSLLFHTGVAQIGQVASALAILALTIGTFVLLRREIGPAGAFCGIAVMLGSPTFVLLWSHETLLWAAFTVWALVAIQREQHARSGALLAFALLCRPETAIAVGVLALWSWRRAGLAAAARLCAFTLAPYALWLWYSWAAFGSLVSQSALAKHAQLLLEGYPYLAGLLVSPGHTYLILLGHAGELAFPLALACIALAARARLWRASYTWFWLWVAATTVAYTLARMHFFAWYGLQVPAAIAFAAAIPWAKGGGSTPKPMLFLARGFSALLVALHLAAFGAMVFTPQVRYNIDDDFVMARYENNAYQRLGAWLQTHSRPQDAVAYSEIGQLRYYSQRRIVSTDGLATPGVARHMLALDGLWTFERYRPEIVVDEPESWISTLDVREADWFYRAYAPSERLFFPDPYKRDDGRDTFVIDRLVHPEAIPAAAEIDESADTSMAVADTPAGMRATFRTGPAGLARVEIRVDTTTCRAGRIALHGAGRTITHSFTTTTVLRDERLTLDTSGLAASSGPYVLEISGCTTAALAPPRYRRDAFSFFPPLVLSTSPKPQAVVAFSR